MTAVKDDIIESRYRIGGISAAIDDSVDTSVNDDVVWNIREFVNASRPQITSYELVEIVIDSLPNLTLPTTIFQSNMKR